MGRKKGGKNKSWSAQEKYEVIKPIIEGKKSSHEVTIETGISNGMISRWVNRYSKDGSKGLENKRNYPKKICILS